MAAISHYEVIGPLGEGGMGEVYVAFDTALQRKVALKAVRRAHRLDESARARLLREARILSQLDHPNICRIYDYVAADDADYLVLELIDGRSLRDALTQRLNRAARMRIAEQVARAFVVAHAAGVIHRDLKPENIMLLPNGDVKVLDFGLARAFENTSTESGAMPNRLIAAALDNEFETVLPADPLSSHTGIVHTAAGALMGSPVYMSPEQARGEPATTASDMFALGLLLQELYSGKRPYQTGLDIHALIESRARGDSVPVEGVSRDIGDLIERLKSLAPSQRPTAVETVDRLRRIRETPARRVRYAAGVVTLVAIAAAGIKYSVDITRERTAAVEAREDAIRRRGQAEALIGFMLGDLRAKLARVGRLDVLDDVGKQAMDYFAAVPPAAMTDEEIYRRSQAVHQLGQVQQAKGDMKGALVAYDESVHLITDVAARNPQNAEWQLGLGTSHFYAGDARRRQGDLDGAMRHFEAYRDIARRLVDRDPNNPTWILELSYGHSNVAAILEGRGDLERARDELALSVGVRQPLITLDPGNREWQEALANAHNRLAIVLDKLADARAALLHFRADLEIRARLRARYPNDTQLQARTAVTESFISSLSMDQGDDAEALAHGLVALGINEALTAHDPANVSWQRELGFSELRLARLQRLQGHYAAAMRRAERAERVLQPLAAKDAAVPRRRFDAAHARFDIGLLHLALGRVAAASAAFASAADTLAAVVASTPKDADARRLLADAWLASADVFHSAGDRQRAQQLRERARDTLQPLAATLRDRRFQLSWARALIGVGRTQEAANIIARLRSSGFRRDLLDALTPATTVTH
jgi:tRNA A-37 threonylcarbamoyl transferase component Bud32/tetratricopeptide (TPR) repeat protein